MIVVRRPTNKKYVWHRLKHPSTRITPHNGPAQIDSVLRSERKYILNVVDSQDGPNAGRLSVNCLIAARDKASETGIY